MKNSLGKDSSEIVRLLRLRAQSAEKVTESLMELATLDSKIDKYGLFSGLDVDVHRVEVCENKGIDVLFDRFGSVSLSDLAERVGCSSWTISVEKDRIRVSFGI